MLKAAERFLRDSLPIAGRIEEDSFERIDEPLFPVAALREALANALCHRDYSISGGSVGVAIYDDRLEITPTGTLHFELTPEKLFTRHTNRFHGNPLICPVLFNRRGIIEEWGPCCKGHGLPGKETSQVHSVTLSEQQQMIFDTLVSGGSSLWRCVRFLRKLQGTMSAKQGQESTAPFEEA